MFVITKNRTQDDDMLFSFISFQSVQRSGSWLSGRTSSSSCNISVVLLDVIEEILGGFSSDAAHSIAKMDAPGSDCRQLWKSVDEQEGDWEPNNHPLTDPLVEIGGVIFTGVTDWSAS